MLLLALESLDEKERLGSCIAVYQMVAMPTRLGTPESRIE
jgi:hypothetical protein